MQADSQGWWMIVVVMGVCGSGNTTVGRRIARRMDWIFVEGDDLHPPGSSSLVEQARIMPEVVFRLRLPDPDARYHVPVIVSPHGYSVWWSG